VDNFAAKSLGRRDGLGLQADPPARESVRRAGAPAKNSSQESGIRGQESEDFRLAIGFYILFTTTWLKICRLVFGFAFFVEAAANLTRLYMPPIRKSAC